MSVNSKMTAIADEVRELSGASEAMGLNDMASTLVEANTEIDSQVELLAQAVAALEGKVGGGGSSIETCTVRANYTPCPFAVTKYEDGVFTAGWLMPNGIGVYSGDIENVVCGSVLVVYNLGSYSVTVDGAEKMAALLALDIFKISATAGAIVTISSTYID